MLRQCRPAYFSELIAAEALLELDSFARINLQKHIHTPKRYRGKQPLCLRYLLYRNRLDPQTELFDWLAKNFLPYELLAHRLGADNQDLFFLIYAIGHDPKDHNLWRALVDIVGLQTLIKELNELIKI